jgi:RNA recognition motif-containing protein
MQTKLYVGNVPWSTTEAELFDLFTAYGAVKSAKIILDRETQKSRGFAFVEFMDEPSAQDAVDQENDREFNGRRLKVNFATERDRNAPRDDRPREPRNDARPPSNTNNNNKDGQRRSRSNKRRDDYAE